MYAIFQQNAFTHFEGLARAGAPAPLTAAGAQAVPRAGRNSNACGIYRSGFQATATRGAAGLLLSATTERRAVQVPLWVRAEEGGGLCHVADLHTYPLEVAGEKAGDEVEKLTRGRVQLSAGQAESRAQAAVGELLLRHPETSRSALLESFQGLWTLAHVDMRAALVEGLRAALVRLKERGVAKQVEYAIIQATMQRAAEAA